MQGHLPGLTEDACVSSQYLSRYLLFHIFTCNILKIIHVCWWMMAFIMMLIIWAVFQSLELKTENRQHCKI